MKKRIFCVLVAAALAFYGITAFGEELSSSGNWSPVPVSADELSSHLYYKIEDGVLVFKNTEKGGILPDYSNISRDDPADYAITEWYKRKNEIEKVIFEESISYIGSYVLTYMDKVTEIVIENPAAEISKNAVLFSTTKRAEPLSIFAASTVKTVDRWIRGSGNRRITEAISEPTMYYTDFEEHIENFKNLEEALMNNGEIEPELLSDTLILLKNVLSEKEYELSDYKKAIVGAEKLIDLLKDELSGKCGENLEYKIAADPETEKFELIITGTGDMYEYENIEDTPWHSLYAYIKNVYISDSVTSISEKAFDENATFIVSVNSFAYSFVKENGFDYKIEKLRILLIGNSHTADYSEFLPNIIADMKNSGLETEIVITKSIIGSIGLFSGRNSNVNAVYRSHLLAIENQSGAYPRLAGSRFDLIIIQDYMESVVDSPEIFKAGLSDFIKTIKTIAYENGQGEPEVAWFADWVDIRSCGGDTSLRDGNGNKIRLEVLTREQVYEKSLANINSVEESIRNGEENMPDFVINGSTIKQNGMSSYFGTTVNYNDKFCLLERDTTHLTYELGRYLLGAGVMAEISAYYGTALSSGTSAVDVASALTLENKPEASGEGNQYSGKMNEETLAVIRESVKNFNTFAQSEYTVDPLDKAFGILENRKWNTSGISDRTSAENAIKKQISDILGSDFDILSAEATDFVSAGFFDLSVAVRYGYSVKQTVIEIRNYSLGDLNLDGFVDVKDSYTARLIVAKLLVPTEEQLLAGDVDSDGKISAIDANIIRKFAAGIIDSLPVQ
ncbi:MAG: hypothetical protein E7479_01765 [Ruminococcaceae bacterium]|nr:hypothetical protein [Oscillospiraceae bacterium]